MWGERGLALLLLASSGGDDGSDTTTLDTSDPGECVDTWEGWAEGFLRTWCTSCHSSELAEGDRYGAPVGIDFDTYTSTVTLAALIERAATGDDPSMPPVGGPEPEGRQRLADWLACGAPGDGGTEPAACSGARSPAAGDVVVTTEADAADLCAADAVTGDLVVRGSVDLSCLCEVSGDLRVEAGAVDVALPNLASVGGDLFVGGDVVHLDVDHVATVGGAVAIEGAPLAEVRLPSLRAVGGDLRVAGLPVADRVDLSRLETVGGSLVLEDLPAFTVLLGEGYNLRSVGGDLVLDDLDAWVGFYGFALLESVGGAVRVVGNDGIIRVNGFTALGELHGVEIRGNDSLEAIDGFDQLDVVAGDLEIVGNRTLQREVGFPALDAVTGTLRIEGNGALDQLGGVLGAGSVGALQIRSNASLWHLGIWELATVDGALEIVDNGDLVNVSGLHGLGSVGGDLTVTGNARLAAADAQALVDAIDSVGGVTTVGNNGP